METEIWKEISGYEGQYWVSNFGRVKSQKQIMKCGNVRRYTKVGLWNGEFQKHYLVHRLVAQAFIPNPENKEEVNHIDGDKTNNNVSNLEWNTRSENCRHAVDVLGKKGNPPHYSGEMASRAKLTQLQADEIREKYKLCNNYAKLGRKYNVDYATIGSIIKNKTYISDPVSHQQI
jgi:hypothetical protein